jgi:hypothetical protein
LREEDKLDLSVDLVNGLVGELLLGSVQVVDLRCERTHQQSADESSDQTATSLGNLPRPGHGLSPSPSQRRAVDETYLLVHVVSDFLELVHELPSGLLSVSLLASDGVHLGLELVPTRVAGRVRSVVGRSVDLVLDLVLKAGGGGELVSYRERGRELGIKEGSRRD